LPIAAKLPSRVTEFKVDSPDEIVASYNPLPFDVHEEEEIVVNPVMTGFAPVPYALNAIGALEVPAFVTLIFP
jgi:NADH:ubiquinone oxidoreductase subunit H